MTINKRREMFKQKAEDLVFVKQGCKLTELSVALAMDEGLDGQEISDVIEELVKEGRLIEIEYVLLNMDYRLKSFLLPKGTQISRMRNEEFAAVRK